MKESFGDKTNSNKSERHLSYNKGELQKPTPLAAKVMELVKEPMMILDYEYRILLVNDSFTRMFNLIESDIIGYKLYELGSDWETSPILTLLNRVKEDNSEVKGVIVSHEFKNLRYSSFTVNIQKDEQLQVLLVNIEVVKKRQKEAVRELEARFDSMINQTTVGIAQIDLSGNFKFVNDRFCEITGRTRDELLQTITMQNLTHPEDLPKNKDLLVKLINEKESFVIEKRYIKADGSNVWVINHVDPIMGQNGQVVGASAAVIDITEHKKTEIAMRESEERYRLINKATNDIIYDWEITTGRLFWNDAVQKLGYTREQLGFDIHKWHEKLHPDYKEKVIQSVEKALAGSDDSWIEEYKFLKSDGTYSIFLDRGYIARDAEGKAYRMIGSLLDLTERKKFENALLRSQKALKKSEEQYKKLFNSIDEGFCVMEILFDKDNKPVNYLFIETNPMFEEMTGLKNAKGKTALDLVPNLERHWIEIYGGVALTGEPIRFVHEAKSMSDRWFEVFAFKFGEGDSRKVALLFDNITKRKHDEAALQDALEKAEKAAKAKEDFLAHMSHEIRTPLNGVLGLTNLLLQQNPKEEQLENLKTLKFSAESLRALVNDILDFSKIQAGKVSLVESDLHLSDFLNSIFKSHKTTAFEKGVDMQLHIDPRIPLFIYTDQLKLSQTLQNLLGNAVKFTKKGYITMHVVLNKREKERYWVDFSVTDTGIGIAADKIESIFDVFTQEDSSTMREYGGTGLGLSISKRLVELMGSQIHVVSEQGKGSKFYFTIPVREGNSANVLMAEMEIEPGETEMDKLNILLVEDVDVNRMVLKQFLSTWWGTTPDEALDGDQAVEMARKKKYDLILMDIRMPVMDGYQATQIIRRMEEYKEVPILALTADTAQEIKKNPEYGLFNDLILKPVEPTDLRKKLMNYGGRKGAKINPIFIPDKVDLSKLEVLMNSDPESTVHFLEKVLNEFERVSQNFELAMRHKDENAMDNIDHKSKMMLNILSLTKIQDHFKKCLGLLSKDPSDDEVNQACERGRILISHAMDSLREQLNNIKTA